MKKIFLLTVLVISSLLAFARQRNSIHLPAPDSQPGYLQVTNVENPALQETHSGKLPGLTAFNLRRSAAGKQNAAGDIISEQPAGELKIYRRSGTLLESYDAVDYEYNPQYGIMKVVYDPDGKTVWFKELLSGLAGYNTWVKGEFTDDKTKINVALGQNVAWLNELQSYIQIQMFVYNSSLGSYVWDESVKNVQYSVENDNIRLLDTDRDRIIGLMYDIDKQWTLFGEYETAYSLFTSQPVTPPAGLQTKELWLNATDNTGKKISEKVLVGTEGNEVYIKGLFCNSVPEGWITGTMNNNKVTFSNYQFVGFYADYYDTYLVGANLVDGKFNVSDFVLTYDPEKNTYSTDMYAIENVLPESVTFIGYYSNISISEWPELDIQKELIKTQPEGELKVYKRDGTSFSTYAGTSFVDPQRGFIMKMVYAPDGKTVYMKDPITQARVNTWIKGYIEGDKIIMPLYQCVDYMHDQDYGVMTAKVVAKSAPDGSKIYTPDFNAKNVSFTIDEATGVISLDELTTEDAVYGLVFTNTLTYNNYADYNSVYTPVTEKPEYIPENMKQETCRFSYHEEGETYESEIIIASDGKKMYVAGLPSVEPQVAVIGEIKDNIVTFNSDQYLGLAATTDATVYFGGAKYRIEKEELYPGTGIMWDRYYYDVLPALEMTYDPEKNTLAAPEGYTFLINAEKPSEKVLYLNACSNPVIKLESGLNSINELAADNKTIAKIEYHNLLGVKLSQPEKGINIVTVTFTDGSKSTQKVAR